MQSIPEPVSPWGLAPGDLYTYSELPTPTSIRLVGLKTSSSSEGKTRPSHAPPSSFGHNDFDPIELSIRVVDLEDYPAYETLSYTWGRPLTVFPSIAERDMWADDPLPVICDGKFLGATPSLLMYLREWRSICAIMADPPPHMAKKVASTGLRLPEEIWIDALCINQNDVDEKGRQVALMGRIYRQTRKTTVWLGPEDAFARPALEILFQLATIPQPVAREARYMGYTARCRALGLPPWDSSLWWPVFAFLQRAWFHRSWVIQELALSPQVQMQCGLLTFTWGDLSKACTNLTECGLGDAIDMWAWFEISGPRLNTLKWDEELNPIIAHSERPDAERGLFTSLKRRQSSYLALMALEQARVASAEAGCDADQRTRGQSLTVRQESHHTSLLHLLDNCRRCGASDPRDKVYAFLEIAKGSGHMAGPDTRREAPHPIQVDYRLSAVQVYLETAWHLLLSSDTLGILSRQHLSRDTESDSGIPNLPSWVPDWSTIPSAKPLASRHDTKWAASGNRRWVPPPREKLHQAFLTVEGGLVDSVVAVTDVSDESRFSPTERAVLIRSSGNPGFSLTKFAVVASGLPRRYPWTSGDQEPGEVLWRTLVANTIHGECPAPKDYHAVFYEEWMETGKRAAGDLHSSHGISDPQKEAEWERCWKYSKDLFPEERGQLEEDRAVERAANDGIEVNRGQGSNVPDLTSGPGRAADFAGLLTASWMRSSGDAFGLWTYKGRPSMRKSQTDIIFDEVIAMCLEDLEKHPSQGDRDPEETVQKDEGGDNNAAVGGYEDEMALAQEAIDLSMGGMLDRDMTTEEQVARLAKLYSDLEELEDKASRDPDLQKALLQTRRGFRRVGNGIVATHSNFFMDLSPEKERVAKAVQGLLREGGSWQPERPTTPTAAMELTAEREALLGGSRISRKPTSAGAEEMAATFQIHYERISTGRAVFRTKTNYLGNGPRSVLPGDQIWVLSGAAMPMVLRPKPNGRFILVGEAYVHGIMMGEAIGREGFSMKDIELEQTAFSGLQGGGVCVWPGTAFEMDPLQRDGLSERFCKNTASPEPLHSFADDTVYYPDSLEKRAWAFQERLLSRCTLIFSQREPLWECDSGRCSECRMDENGISHTLTICGYQAPALPDQSTWLVFPGPRERPWTSTGE